MTDGVAESEAASVSLTEAVGEHGGAHDKLSVTEADAVVDSVIVIVSLMLICADSETAIDSDEDGVIVGDEDDVSVDVGEAPADLEGDDKRLCVGVCDVLADGVFETDM